MNTNTAFFSRAQNTLAQFQGFYLLSVHGLTALFRKPRYFREIVEQMEHDGFGSVGIIAIVLAFIGMALSLQIMSELSFIGLQIYTGQIVGTAVISEIGPVVAAIVYAGRAGSGMASELGSMVLHQQVDALRVYGVDPIGKLVTPRLMSGAVMVPCLVLIGDAIALAGGAYIAVVVNRQSFLVYWNSIKLVFLARFVIPGVLKPIVFGYIIAAMGCFMGLTTHGGATGLKRSTTQAFVLSVLVIIILDFVITKVLLLSLGRV